METIRELLPRMIERLATAFLSGNHLERGRGAFATFGYTFARLGGALFCTPFLAGGVFIASLTLRDLWTLMGSGNWVETSARISMIEFRTDSDGDEKVDFVYTYEFEGVSYESDRFAPTTMGGLGNDQGLALMHGLEVDNGITCWVDPAKPELAVLNRDFYLSSWIGIPFSIPFIATGLGGWLNLFFGGLYFRYRRSIAGSHLQRARDEERHKLAEIIEGRESEWTADTTREHRKLLAPCSEAHRGITMFLGLNLFVNGILSVFVISFFAVLFSGSWFGALFLGLFLTPFVTAGWVIFMGLVDAARRLRAPHWLFGIEGLPVGFRPAEIEVEWLRLHDPDDVKITDQPFEIRFLRGDPSSWFQGVLRAMRGQKAPAEPLWSTPPISISPQDSSGSFVVDLETCPDSVSDALTRPEKKVWKPGEEIWMELRWANSSGRERIASWDLMPSEPSSD